MQKWELMCVDAQRAAVKIGLVSPELMEAVERGSAEDAVAALSPLMMMFEGVHRFLEKVSHWDIKQDVRKQVDEARDLVIRAFEQASAADSPPMTADELAASKPCEVATK